MIVSYDIQIYSTKNIYLIIQLCLFLSLQSVSALWINVRWGRILVQVTIYRRLLIDRDGHLDRSEAYDIS